MKLALQIHRRFGVIPWILLPSDCSGCCVSPKWGRRRRVSITASNSFKAGSGRNDCLDACECHWHGNLCSGTKPGAAVMPQETAPTIECSAPTTKKKWGGKDGTSAGQALSCQ